jgi:hypothetical protein
MFRSVVSRVNTSSAMRRALSSSSSGKVGLIGLGNMGQGMAANLINSAGAASDVLGM